MRNQKRVAILIKTNLKFDGRVIAEIDTLAAHYPDVHFKVFLLSNDEYEPVDFPPNVSIELVEVFTRNWKFKRYLLPLSAFIFTISCFFKVQRFKPDMLHVHDIFPLPVAYLYTRFYSPFLIYDDHELFKQNPNLFEKGLYWFEMKVLKSADKILIANGHRGKIVRWIYEISEDKLKVLENFNHIRAEENIEFNDQPFLDLLEDLRNKGLLAILHQGQVSEGRGLNYLLEVAENIANQARIIFMGISNSRYESLVTEYPILKGTSVNIGYKPYNQINEYWSRVDASLIFYDTADVNNKYCAPNRLYLALSNKKPLLVNSANPVLNTAIHEHNAGVSISISNVEIKLNEFLPLVRQKGYYLGNGREFTFKKSSAPILLEVYEEAFN